MAPATAPMATIASAAIPNGDVSASRNELELDERWSVKRTSESELASRRFVHVAELAVLLLG